MQAIIARELGKAPKEWQLHKPKIVDAIQKVESKVDQHLLALEGKMDKTEQNVKPINERTQELEQ